MPSLPTIAASRDEDGVDSAERSETLESNLFQDVASLGISQMLQAFSYIEVFLFFDKH